MTPPSVQQIAVPQLPQAPSSPPVFGMQAGNKPGRKTPTASFLNSTAVPAAAQLGNKQLVGQ